MPGKLRFPLRLHRSHTSSHRVYRQLPRRNVIDCKRTVLNRPAQALPSANERPLSSCPRNRRRRHMRRSTCNRCKDGKENISPLVRNGHPGRFITCAKVRVSAIPELLVTPLIRNCQATLWHLPQVVTLLHLQSVEQHSAADGIEGSCTVCRSIMRIGSSAIANPERGEKCGGD